MKKICLFFAFTLVAFVATAQCFIDSAARTTPGIYPASDSIPCIISAVPYQQVIQVQCPSSFDSTVNLVIIKQNIVISVDSMELDSVIGLPYGISWTKSSNTLLGGQNGCLNFTGTTTDRTGKYNLLWYGKVWGKLPSPVPAQFASENYTGVLNKLHGFDYYVSVINQGDACPPSNLASVKDISLNDAISIYPNPANGIFEFKLNANDMITGSIVIADITHRIVFSQQINEQQFYQTTIDLDKLAKGIYTLELITSAGFASRKIILQ